MSGVNRGQPQSQQVRVRVRLRPKAQLTLPEEVRHALHVHEGDDLEFAVQDDGTVTVRGFVAVPSDQVWRYTPPQAEERPPGQEPPA